MLVDLVFCFGLGGVAYFSHVGVRKREKNQKMFDLMPSNVGDSAS